MEINMFIDLFSHFRFRQPFTDNYKLEVHKYSAPNFYAISKVTEDYFELDIIELAYATARTMCSYHVRHQEYYFDVISSLLSHFNFIEKNADNYLVISESRYIRLRDFSRTTRVGEMAQAINSLFVANRLNFPFIIDFDLAKEKTQNTLNIQTNGKTPDFVVVNREFSKLGLFESKGSGGKKPNITAIGSYLHKAQEQINDVTNPCFDTNIPVCVRFENNKDFTYPNQNPTIKNSSINYGLIEKNCTDKKDLKPLIKLQYTSWFYLVGDFKRVTNLLNQEIIAEILIENDPDYAYDKTTDEENPIFWVSDRFMQGFSSAYGEIYSHLTITSRYFREGELKIGIYESVIKFLRGESDTMNFPEGNTEELKRFGDGTVILMKSNRN